MRTQTTTYHKNFYTASGNAMATYKSEGGASVKIKEHNIFGSNRLGIALSDIVMTDIPASNTELSRVVGEKYYELSNHLGNVLSTISDKPLGVDNDADGKADYYLADIVSANDYYPGGSSMSGRTFSSDLYRYGFGGHEKDDEVKGSGNHISFEDYGYDPRLVRRWNIDPRFAKYPNQSPYSAFNGNPVLFKDPTGESGEVSIDAASKTITITSNIAFYGNGANTKVAKQSAADIQNAWNAAGGKATIGGVQYDVKFVVTGSYMPDITAIDISSNTDIKNNYVRVESSGAPISYYHTNGNTGFFLTKNINKDGSTTEPHEYGHGLGLWPGTSDGHPANTDLVGSSTPPGIMYPRGTAVDAQFTYDPSKGATATDPTTGVRTNTMNPNSRKVNQTDIDMLGLDKLTYVNGKANIGTTTNSYIPNNTGTPDTSPTGPRREDGSF